MNFLACKHWRRALPEVLLFRGPYGIVFTTSGNNNILYVSDNGNNLIGRIRFPK